VINVYGVLMEKEILNSNYINFKKGDYIKDPETKQIYRILSIDWQDDTILATLWVCQSVKHKYKITILETSINRFKRIETKEELVAELL
jgi:hypothetical protein